MKVSWRTFSRSVPARARSRMGASRQKYGQWRSSSKSLGKSIQENTTSTRKDKCTKGGEIYSYAKKKKAKR